MNLSLADGLSLTAFRRTDVDALIEYLNDRDLYDRTLRIPYPYTIAAAEQWFSIAIPPPDRVPILPVHWAIRDSAARLIGSVGLEGFSRVSPHRTEIGYWLAKPYWGRGIMPRAVMAVCRYAFDEIGLEKITAHVFATNEASARVLQKCGFSEEGLLRRHFVKDGSRIDARLFGLLC